MEAVFHMGKESDRYFHLFTEKRADYAVQELRDYGSDLLKALLRTLQEDNRTFDEKIAAAYN